jgi:regulation of enolase protein 1 (concanavalin A-like superfamily)
MRTRPDGDYRIETKLVINPSQAYQGAGLILFLDEQNESEMCRGVGAGQTINASITTAGVRTYYSGIVPTDTLVYFRMTSFGNTIFAEWSPDGINWSTVMHGTAPWATNPQVKIGLWAVNGGYEGYSAPHIPADFDYLKAEELDTTNRSLLSDGDGDHVDCGSADSVRLTDAFTIELLVKFQTQQSDIPFVARDEGPGNYVPKWVLGYDYHPPIIPLPHRLAFHVNGPGAPEGGYWAASDEWILNPQLWYHIALVVSNHMCSFYVDGQNAGTDDMPADIPPINSPLTIAHSEGASSFGGEIDEVRIWNHARTQAQIQAYMNCELTGSENGLLAYYQFNEQEEQTVYDSGPWGYHGTLIGDATTFPSDAPISGECAILQIAPMSLDFGLLDLGADSSSVISLYNPSDVPVLISAIFHSLPDFIIDTTGLNGQVAPQETYYMGVTFMPSAVGTYIDTLIIVAEQTGDDTIRIPLSGAADVVLPAVEGLVIQRGPLNGIQLRWPRVTHTISGQPITADYIIYGATSLEGEFQPFGFTADTTYVHPYILNSQPIYFYYITASPEGSLSLEQIREILKLREGN